MTTDDTLWLVEARRANSTVHFFNTVFARNGSHAFEKFQRAHPGESFDSAVVWREGTPRPDPNVALADEVPPDEDPPEIARIRYAQNVLADLLDRIDDKVIAVNFIPDLARTLLEAASEFLEIERLENSSTPIDVVERLCALLENGG